MKPIITKFNDKTGDFEITISVPFTLKDGIKYVNMMVADVPKYEDTKDYNVFDLIRENQKLKNQQKEFIQWLESEISFIKNTYSQINGDYMTMNPVIKNWIAIMEKILSKYKEIIGDKE